MRMILVAITIVYSIAVTAQQPFIGNRLFLSQNKQDSLSIVFGTKKVTLQSDVDTIALRCGKVVNGGKIHATNSDTALFAHNVDSVKKWVYVKDSIQVATLSNGLVIDSSKAILLRGNSTCWDDDNLDPTTLTGTGTAPVATTWASTSISIAGFAKGDEVQGTREIPHAAKLGAPIYFHAHWAANTTNVGNVRFGLEYFFTRSGVAVTTSTTITVTAATDGTAWKKFNTAFAAITPPAAELGMQFHFRFYRINEGADTYTGLVLCSTIGYHYEIDGFGSKWIITK